MILGLPIQEIAWLALAILVAGVLTGLLAGLFGIGGGAVIVPVLYEVFRILGVAEGIRLQLCIGTSLAIIVPTTIRSYIAHRDKGSVLSDVIKIWLLPSTLGVIVGSVAAAVAPAAVFKIAFVIIAGIIASKLLFGNGRWSLGTDLPGTVAMNIYGFFVGLSASLMGVSGGSLSNMVLTLYGTPIHKSVATSAGIGVPITIVGTLGYVLAGLTHRAELPPLSIGFVSVIGVALVAPVSSYVAPFGARLAHALPKRKLEVAFGIYLVLVSARFVASLLSS